MIIGLSIVLGLIVIAVGIMFSQHIVPIGLGMHKNVFQKNKTAINGYDVTSYFQNDPQMGKKEYVVEYNGVKWNFASAENQRNFEANPERYLPQYGGYCVKAVSAGFAVPPSPNSYHIYEGKLYLFSDDKVKANFLEAPDKMVASCSKTWKN